MKMVAFRSKKSGRFFKFEQYADDGWGKYEDSVLDPVNDPGDLPTFFLEESIKHYFGEKGVWLGSEFRDHKWEDLEQVLFTLEQKGEVK